MWFMQLIAVAGWVAIGLYVLVSAFTIGDDR